MALLLDNSENKYFSEICAESYQLGVDKVRFYSLDKKKVRYDEVYGEAVGYENYDFPSPYLVECFFEKPTNDNSDDERGFKTEYDVMCSFSSLLLDEGGVPYPKAGDVIEWDYQYDITRVEKEGFVGSGNDYVQINCYLKRRTESISEKITG